MKCDYKIGQIIEGVITGVKPYGAFVKVDEQTTGLIHISEISDDFVRDINFFVKQGEKIISKVIDVDKENHQLRLSLKALNYSHRKERLKKVQKRSLLPDNDIGFDSLKEHLPLWIEEK